MRDPKMIYGPPPEYVQCPYCEDEGKVSMARYVGTREESLDSYSEEMRREILKQQGRPFLIHDYKCPECGATLAK